MNSSRYYIGSYRKALKKKLSTEFLFYYKIKCAFGRKRIYEKDYIQKIHDLTNIPKTTIKRNIVRLIRCGFMIMDEDVRGRDYFQIVATERIIRILGMKISYKKVPFNRYNRGLEPNRWQYTYLTFRHKKKKQLLANITGVEMKFNLKQQEFAVFKKKTASKSSSDVTMLLKAYRETERKAINRCSPADITISNMTTARLLGYTSQAQGNKLTQSLLTNKVAYALDTGSIKQIAYGVPQSYFDEFYSGRKYFYHKKKQNVYTRDCTLIHLN